MYKLPWTIIALALATLMLTVFTPPLHAQTTRGVGSTAFSCEQEGEDSRDKSSTCRCSGVSDCSRMAGSGICKGEGKTDNTRCSEIGCRCTMGGSRVSPGGNQRPKAEVPATRNAPQGRNTRDHRPTSTTTPVSGRVKPRASEVTPQAGKP